MTILSHVNSPVDDLFVHQVAAGFMLVGIAASALLVLRPEWKKLSGM